MPNTEAIAIGYLQTAVAGEREDCSRAHCHLGTEGVPFLTNCRSLFQIGEALDHHSAIARAIFLRLAKRIFSDLIIGGDWTCFSETLRTEKSAWGRQLAWKKFAWMLIVWQHFNKQMKTVYSNENSAAVIATRSTKNNGLAYQPRLTTNVVIVGN